MRTRKVSPVTARACAVVLAAVCVLMQSSVQARMRVSYPNELHGFWIPDGIECPKPGESYDGDQMLDIAAEHLHGYEETSKPTKVALLSKLPKTWRVESLIDIGPSGVFEKDEPRIFVLGKWTLTVVDDDNATVFKRCQKS